MILLLLLLWSVEAVAQVTFFLPIVGPTPTFRNLRNDSFICGGKESLMIEVFVVFVEDADDVVLLLMVAVAVVVVDSSIFLPIPVVAAVLPSNVVRFSTTFISNVRINFRWSLSFVWLVRAFLFGIGVVFSCEEKWRVGGNLVVRSGYEDQRNRLLASSWYNRMCK